MARETRRRGPYAKGAARRAAIAEAAADLVLERGHRALRVGDVAARTGVSEAAVLYHHPSRDHLLVAAMTELQRRQAATLQPGMPMAEWVRWATTDALRHPHARRLFAHVIAQGADPDHPAHAFALDHQRMVRETSAAALRELQAAGIAHPDVDPQRFGVLFLATWDGLQSQWLVDPDSVDLEAEVSEAFRRLSGQDTMAARHAVAALAERL